MAHYDIYRDQLATTHPSFGHALWDPTPEGENGPVKVGDVGYVREGRFFRLFNALLPADDPAHKETRLPEYHEPLIPNVTDHIFKRTLKPNHYCSAGVNIGPTEPDYLATGPEEFDQASFSCRRRHGGAVLYLPVEAQSQNTRARGDFGKWMLKHIDRWFAFARDLGLGIDQMEEIILVTGCDCTTSWANVAFLEGQTHGQASFGVNVVQGRDSSVNWNFSPRNTQGAVCNWGPEGKNLREDQCVFIRGFRVVRILGILPRQLKGAAGPNPSPDGDHDDDEPGKEFVSIPASAKYPGPLRVLINYITERAPDCDMVIIHDDDLARIQVARFHDGEETLLPDTLMIHLQTSQPEVQQISCDFRSTNGDSLKLGTENTTVAMFSEEFHQWCCTLSPPSNVGFSQSCAHQPDHRVNQAQEGGYISWRLASVDDLSRDNISEGTSPVSSFDLSNLKNNLLEYQPQRPERPTTESTVMPVSDTAHPYEKNTYYLRARNVCVYCSKSFTTIQGLERHWRDKHAPARRCPFCHFVWTRPDIIKAHIITDHDEKFTAEILEGIKALYGQRIIEFVDAYGIVPDVEAVGGMATIHWARNRATSDVGLQVRDNDRMDANATTLLCESVPTTSKVTQDGDIDWQHRDDPRK